MSTTRRNTVAARVVAATKKAPEPPNAGSDKAVNTEADLPTKSMNRQDLVAEVADLADLPKTKASAVVDAVFNVIQTALKEKAEVRLTGFGTFSVSTRKATTGRNPRTGEAIGIPESTQVRFKAGKGLKDSVS